MVCAYIPSEHKSVQPALKNILLETELSSYGNAMNTFS